jgi:hypothetical protein
VNGDVNAFGKVRLWEADSYRKTSLDLVPFLRGRLPLRIGGEAYERGNGMGTSIM